MGKKKKKIHSSGKKSGKKWCIFLILLCTFLSAVYIGRGSTAMNLGTYAASPLDLSVYWPKNWGEKEHLRI